MAMLSAENIKNKIEASGHHTPIADEVFDSLYGELCEASSPAAFLNDKYLELGMIGKKIDNANFSYATAWTHDDLETRDSIEIIREGLNMRYSNLFTFINAVEACLSAD
ncbi:MAG: hypothetical protein Q4E57_03890 [Eubacteriales bacterium]|nr:hypothetical protein [Eubacteriales bacterium]